MNFILTRDKAITIAPAALKLSGIPDDAKLELTTLDGAVILTRSKMTAMEYVKLLTELTAHVGQMNLTDSVTIRGNLWEEWHIAPSKQR